MRILLLLLALATGCAEFSGTSKDRVTPAPSHALVFMTDFGVRDGAVAAMKGVAIGVESRLRIEDLTHEIPAYDIWQAAYRLDQTVDYWPAGTVFVCVVDPGVGTKRASVVARLGTGQVVVTPDNGTLTLVADRLGIEALHRIDETSNRLEGSRQSHTFHGRDVYAYTGARMAASVITIERAGPALPKDSIVRLKYQRAKTTGATSRGTIPVLDPQYGNVWTNIDRDTFEKTGAKKTDRIKVTIRHGVKKVWAGEVPLVDTFGDVPKGKLLLYYNSLGNVALAINMGNFARTHGVGSGPDWHIELHRPRPVTPKKAPVKKAPLKKAGPPKKAPPKKAPPKKAPPKKAPPKKAPEKQ